jgi:protein SCO1/2
MPIAFSRRQVLACSGSLLLAPAHARADGAPPSVYALSASLFDQDGRPFEFGSLRGAPVLASMFYTSCDMVCPMIFETIHAQLAALPAAVRNEIKVLMVSFDPARDTAAVLKKTAQQRDCDPRWTLARGDEATVRKMAAVFGIQYRRLANGEFSHTSTILLLDREGRIAAATGKLGAADRGFVKAIVDSAGPPRA